MVDEKERKGKKPPSRKGRQGASSNLDTHRQARTGFQTTRCRCLTWKCVTLQRIITKILYSSPSWILNLLHITPLLLFSSTSGQSINQSTSSRPSLARFNYRGIHHVPQSRLHRAHQHQEPNSRWRIEDIHLWVRGLLHCAVHSLARGEPQLIIIDRDSTVIADTPPASHLPL